MSNPTTAEMEGALPPQLHEMKRGTYGPCASCAQITHRRCVICVEVFFCSPQCLDNDPTSHLLLCSEHAAFMKTAKGRHYRAALLFPEDQQQPRWVWTPAYNLRDFDEHMGRAHRTRVTDIAVLSARKDFNLTLVLVAQVREPTEQQLQNPFITGLEKVPESAGSWPGPILAMRKTGHMQMRDVPHIVEYMRTTARNYAMLEPNLFAEKSIVGLKLNSLWATTQHKVSDIQTVCIPKNVGLYHLVSTIQFFYHAGIELMVYPYREEEATSTNNHGFLPWLAKKFHSKRISATGDSWDPVPLSDITAIKKSGLLSSTTIFVYREDQKPLLPEHWEAMEEYIFGKCEEVASQDPDSSNRKERWVDGAELLGVLSKKSFGQFWIGFAQTFLERNGLDVEPPFEMSEDDDNEDVESVRLTAGGVLDANGDQLMAEEIDLYGV